MRSPQQRLDLYRDARETYLAAARAKALEIARRDGTVDADKLAREFPLPEGLAPQTVAAVFRCNLFQKVEVTISKRPDRVGGYMGVYTLTH